MNSIGRRSGMSSGSSSNLCQSCLWFHVGWERDRYGKRTRPIHSCSMDRTKKRHLPVGNCPDYSRAPSKWYCASCGTELKTPPEFVTTNHAFCSESCRSAYLTAGARTGDMELRLYCGMCKMWTKIEPGNIIMCAGCRCRPTILWSGNYHVLGRTWVKV